MNNCELRLREITKYANHHSIEEVRLKIKAIKSKRESLTSKFEDGNAGKVLLEIEEQAKEVMIDIYRMERQLHDS